MKSSELYWDKATQPNTVEHTSPGLFKKNYDELVAIESKIDLLIDLKEKFLGRAVDMYLTSRLGQYSNLLADLTRLHNL